MTPQEEFTAMDLYHNGMSGSQSAAEKRDALGAELGIGYGNVKKMVERLNHYGVTRDDSIKHFRSSKHVMREKGLQYASSCDCKP